MGLDFFQANDGKNADAPIRDVFAAGRYLKNRFQVEPRKIGTFGYSHGGWAAIRSVTYPKKEESFPFGFAIAGGLLQGGHVMKTIGKGIVTSELSVLAVLTALICAGVFVAMATLLRLPVSTSEAIVGGVLGVGIASGADLNLTTILAIAGMGHLPHTRGGSGSPHLPSYEVPAEKAGEESLLATAPTGNAAGKRCIHLILPWSQSCRNCNGPDCESWILDWLAWFVGRRFVGSGSNHIWSPCNGDSGTGNHTIGCCKRLLSSDGRSTSSTLLRDDRFARFNFSIDCRRRDCCRTPPGISDNPSEEDHEDCSWLGRHTDGCRAVLVRAI